MSDPQDNVKTETFEEVHVTEGEDGEEVIETITTTTTTTTTNSQGQTVTTTTSTDDGTPAIIEAQPASPVSDEPVQPIKVEATDVAEPALAASIPVPVTDPAVPESASSSEPPPPESASSSEPPPASSSSSEPTVQPDKD